MNYSIFISYSSKDLDLVSKLFRYLKADFPFLDIYVAEYNAHVGIVIARDVVEAIWKCNAFIVLWSCNSGISEWVRFETYLAHGFGRHIIPIKLDKESNLPDYLSSVKYLALYKYKSLEDGCAALVAQLKHEVTRYAVSCWLIGEMERNKYDFSENEEDFYEFARSILSRPNRGTVIFKSGSPVIVLPEETYTHSRLEYLETILHRFSKKGNLTRGIYSFDYERTMHRLEERYTERAKLRKHVKRITPVLGSSSIAIYGLKRSSHIPSGLLTEEEGALVLRDPYDKLVGVYFIKGKEIECLRNRLYLPAITPRNVLFEEQWIKALRSKMLRRL